MWLQSEQNYWLSNRLSMPWHRIWKSCIRIWCGTNKIWICWREKCHPWEIRQDFHAHLPQVCILIIFANGNLTEKPLFFFSDEVRVPGVITYSTCNVNTDAMMNKKTGHISVRHPGDYFLSFTANMVSVNSQAIWCAIYKQSAGNDAWQVLGMLILSIQKIKNYFSISFIK